MIPSDAQADSGSPAAPRRFGTVARKIAFAIAMAGLYGAANSLAAQFQIAPGVSIIFPATAVAVVACVWLGWVGALAVLAGTFLAPWNDQSWHQLLVFGLINAGEGMLPAWILRRSRLDPGLADPRSLLTFIVAGVVINTGVSAAAGNSLLTHFAPGQIDVAGTQLAEGGLGGEYARALLVWWFADAIASFTLAIPALMLGSDAIRAWLGSGVPMDSRPRAAFLWRHHAATLAVIAGLLLAASALLGYTDNQHIGFFHWFAVLFFAPIIVGSLRLGLRGGVTVAGIVSLLFIGIVAFNLVLLPASADMAPFMEKVLTIYFSILTFWTAGVAVGILADSERHLTAELRWKNTLLKSEFLSTVQALSAAIEAKDPSTVGHHRQVADYAAAIGTAFNLEDEALEMLRYAAELLDVGKIAVPDHILAKAGPLDAREQELMSAHAQAGARILERVDLLREAAPAVASHHERFDGSTKPPFPAYPGELSGEHIPLAARILHVADAFDAMTTERSYRPKMPPAHAMQELLQESGKQFDGRVVEALLDVLASRDKPTAALVTAARAARPF